MAYMSGLFSKIPNDSFDKAPITRQYKCLRSINAAGRFWRTGKKNAETGGRFRQFQGGALDVEGKDDQP
jgi:hypothetical protein